MIVILVDMASITVITNCFLYTFYTHVKNGSINKTIKNLSRELIMNTLNLNLVALKFFAKS